MSSSARERVHVCDNFNLLHNVAGEHQVHFRQQRVTPVVGVSCMLLQHSQEASNTQDRRLQPSCIASLLFKLSGEEQQLSYAAVSGSKRPANCLILQLPTAMLA